LQDESSLDHSDSKGNAKRAYDDDPTQLMSPGILSEIMKSSKRSGNEFYEDDLPVNIRKVERTAKANNQKGKYEQPNGIITRPYLEWKAIEDLDVRMDETQIERKSNSNEMEAPRQAGILGNYRTIIKTTPTGNGLPRSVYGISDEKFRMIIRARNLISGNF